MAVHVEKYRKDSQKSYVFLVCKCLVYPLPGGERGRKGEGGPAHVKACKKAFFFRLAQTSKDHVYDLA